MISKQIFTNIINTTYHIVQRLEHWTLEMRPKLDFKRLIMT
jgi:hypothetical protein